VCPWAPPRACRSPRCARLLGPGERCPEHEAPFADSTYRELPPIPARLRRQIRKRDGGVCQICGANGTDVDHRVPRSAGGSDQPENLWLLCGPCHASKTGRDAARARYAR